MQHFNEQLYIIVLIKFYLTPLILPIKKKKKKKLHEMSII